MSDGKHGKAGLRTTNTTDELRSRFTVAEILNTICHDIRATLSVTAGSVAELASVEYGPLTDMQRQLVGILQRGNLRLTRLAGNLAHLSELWEGTAELHPTRVDLAALVRQVTDDLTRQDTQSRIRCELVVPNERLEAEVDLERTRQALVNIIGIALALAHTRVAVVVQRNGGRAEVSIEDDGPERHMISRAMGAKRVASTELTLAITEHLLRLHAGELQIESPLGPTGGCRTVVSMPT